MSKVSKSTDELISQINPRKKQATKQATGKPWVERAMRWIDHQILPYLGIGLMVAGTTYAGWDLIQYIDLIPAQLQSGIVVVALAFVFSRAFRFFSGRKSHRK